MIHATEHLFSKFKGAQRTGGTPLYMQLKRGIEDAVLSGHLEPGDALPSERDIASRADISRVTVRKAVQSLVKGGVLVQRHGSGTFVASRPERVEQSLSRLTSFSEDMARRGQSAHSQWLERGVFAPSPDEMMALGLASDEKVARLARIRIVNGIPLAIERASLSAAILPHPEDIGPSLYAALEQHGAKPVRAMQRISAANVAGPDAVLLQLPEGSACLRIERISYLSSGKVVEFTRSLYRGESYDFVAELRLGDLEDGGA